MFPSITPASQLESSAVVSVGTSPTPLLLANDERRQILIQNLSMVPVFIYFGDGCTTSKFSFILPAGTANTDGTGGVFTEDTLSYQGDITACVSSGSANVVVTSI